MRAFAQVLGLLFLALVPPPAHSISLSGLLIYSTDDFGDPSGYEWDKEALWGGELARTAAHPHWYGLGILAGVPPESFRGRLLNAPDYSVEIPLVEGENDFTLLGTFGTGTEWDEHFALNLFFDGANAVPGVSVLFPRTGTWNAALPSPSNARILLGLALNSLSGTPDYVYDDGVFSVRVMDMHYLPDDAYPDVDLISKHSPTPGDGNDRVGILRILVESQREGPSSAAERPRTSGVVADLPVVTLQPAYPLPTQEQTAPLPALPGGGRTTAAAPRLDDGAPPPPDPLGSATPEQTPNGATPSPATTATTERAAAGTPTRSAAPTAPATPASSSVSTTPRTPDRQESPPGTGPQTPAPSASGTPPTTVPPTPAPERSGNRAARPSVRTQADAPNLLSALPEAPWAPRVALLLQEPGSDAAPGCQVFVRLGARIPQRGLPATWPCRACNSCRS